MPSLDEGLAVNVRVYSRITEFVPEREKGVGESLSFLGSDTKVVQRRRPVIRDVEKALLWENTSPPERRRVGVND